VINGLNTGEQPITWGADGRSLYIYQPGELPAKVYNLDLQTGKRTLWKQLLPRQRSGRVYYLGRGGYLCEMAPEC